jgi:hypothetical protein
MWVYQVSSRPARRPLRRPDKAVPAKTKAPPNLDLLYRVARSRLDWQLQFLDGLDLRLGLFLTVGTGLIAVVGAPVGIVGGISWLGLAALAVVVGSYAAVAWYSMIGLRERNWEVGPKSHLVARSLRLHGGYESERRTILTLLLLHKKNETAYYAKVDATRPTLVALVVETIASAAVLALAAHR